MASAKTRSAAGRLRAATPVLITESVDEFVALRKSLDDEIKPNGVIEQAWVDDLAAVIWEIMRLSRIRAEIVNGAFCEALIKMLEQVWSKNFKNYAARDREIEDLAWDWLANDSDARAKVSELLDHHRLDEKAIEAESFRMRAVDLERLDFMVGRAELRREKLLTGIAAFRQGLAKLVRQVSDQLLEQPVAEQIVPMVTRRS